MIANDLVKEQEVWSATELSLHNKWFVLSSRWQVGTKRLSYPVKYFIDTLHNYNKIRVRVYMMIFETFEQFIDIST